MADKILRHKPSPSAKILHLHLPNKAKLTRRISLTPKAPSLFGLQMFDQLAQDILFPPLDPPHKKHLCRRTICFQTSTGIVINDKKKMVMEFKTELIKTTLPLRLTNLLDQELRLDSIRLTNGSQVLEEWEFAPTGSLDT